MASEGDCHCNCYKCLKWSLVVFFVIQTIIILLLLVIVIASKALAEEPHTHSDEDWQFIHNNKRVALFVAGSVTVLMAVAVGLYGALKEHVWTILACVILEVIATLLFVLAIWGDVISTTIIIILGIIWLICMFNRGQQNKDALPE